MCRPPLIKLRGQVGADVRKHGVKPAAPGHSIDQAIEKGPNGEDSASLESGAELATSGEDSEQAGAEDRVVQSQQDSASEKRRAQYSLPPTRSRPERDGESEHHGQRRGCLAERTRG